MKRYLLIVATVLIVLGHIYSKLCNIWEIWLLLWKALCIHGSPVCEQCEKVERTDIYLTIDHFIILISPSSLITSRNYMVRISETLFRVCWAFKWKIYHRIWLYSEKSGIYYERYVALLHSTDHSKHLTTLITLNHSGWLPCKVPTSSSGEIWGSAQGYLDMQPGDLGI